MITFLKKLASAIPTPGAGKVTLFVDDAGEPKYKDDAGEVGDFRGPAGPSVWGGISGDMSTQADLKAALDGKAPLASPALTGTPTAPTPAVSTNSTQLETSAGSLAKLLSFGLGTSSSEFVDTAGGKDFALLGNSTPSGIYTISGSWANGPNGTATLTGIVHVLQRRYTGVGLAVLLFVSGELYLGTGTKSATTWSPTWTRLADNAGVVHNTGDETVAGAKAFSSPTKLSQYTLSTLPSAATYSGYYITVTNATGGPKLCYSNGTNWLIANTATVVS